jgi:hypothetical protein
LAKTLKAHGFNVWLDEKELLIGDPLPQKVSEAIDRARAVIIVVSAASGKSKWLRFELNKATQRMITGGCRVLPVLIQRAELFPELSALLYADFRKRPRSAWRTLLETLRIEASRYPKIPRYRLDSSNALDRQRALDKLIQAEFDGHGWADMDISATRSVSWEVLTLYQRPGPEISVAYQEVTDYIDKREPLMIHDWDDFVLTQQDEYGEQFGLLVSQRPPSSQLRDQLYADSSHVRYAVHRRTWHPKVAATILCDVSDRPSEAASLARIHRVQALIIRLDRESRESDAPIGSLHSSD